MGDADVDDEECSICLETLCSPPTPGGNGELLRTPCEHVYHRACLLDWFKNGSANPGGCCPLCNNETSEAECTPISYAKFAMKRKRAADDESSTVSATNKKSKGSLTPLESNCSSAASSSSSTSSTVRTPQSTGTVPSSSGGGSGIQVMETGTVQPFGTVSIAAERRQWRSRTSRRQTSQRSSYNYPQNGPYQQSSFDQFQSGHMTYQQNQPQNYYSQQYQQPAYNAPPHVQPYMQPGYYQDQRAYYHDQTATATYQGQTANYQGQETCQCPQCQMTYYQGQGTCQCRQCQTVYHQRQGTNYEIHIHNYHSMTIFYGP